MSVFRQDQDLRYSWVCNPGQTWLCDVREGMSDHDVLASSALENSIEIKRRVLANAEPVRFEFLHESARTVRWYDIQLDVDRDENGEVSGILGTSIDITERKRREDTLKTLLRELSHRSKNLLAIIQSLASQTARHSLTVPEFLVRFRGRIQSLSYSQDIVTDTNWRGAQLDELINLQVERYAPDGNQQIKSNVAAVYLSPTASLHVGLALHELAVNAASYGSLSVPGGQVEITTEFETIEDHRDLALIWKESHGPRVRQNRDPRFGTATLERIVPNAVGGTAKLTHEPDGVLYRLVIPDAQFELTNETSGH
ncbi:HWE histidine kinase domain-containing protein [Fulvimarina sp. 2208YS6-2-32]|uniref:histidine kinase n=1 Tax=Fulvimarina uroteuthidis TaxID=3098149 RepID=A0ABU5I4T5_9HYPH|nr:HWE histidine kinase domain-containing protein [Fulvimarina sp. 2208YS6-2-32]MDY8110384.1 HWE histidine kinase domain-containing protein [Fulvimarina sp. 2208YS6-2-32]